MNKSSEKTKGVDPLLDKDFTRKTFGMIEEVVREVRSCLWVGPTVKELRLELTESKSTGDLRRGKTAISLLAARSELSFIAKLLADQSLIIADLVEAVQSLKAANDSFERKGVTSLKNACDMLLAHIDGNLD